MSRRERPGRQKSTFPHKETCVVLGVSALTYCVYNFFQTLTEQRQNTLQNELDALIQEESELDQREAFIYNQQRLESSAIDAHRHQQRVAQLQRQELELQRQQRLADRRTHKTEDRRRQPNINDVSGDNISIQSLYLDPIIAQPEHHSRQHSYHTQGALRSDGHTTPTDLLSFNPDSLDTEGMMAVGCDDDYGPPLSPPSKQSSSSRMSIASQPASPATRSILGKVEGQMNGTQLWDQMDRFNEGKVAKDVVVTMLLQQLYLDDKMTGDEKITAMTKAVEKIAGKRQDYVSRARWFQHVGQDKKIEFNDLIDTVD